MSLGSAAGLNDFVITFWAPFEQLISAFWHLKASRIHRIRGNGRKLPKINGILPKIKATKMTGNQLKCIDCSRRPNKSIFFDVQTVSSAISVFCFQFSVFRESTMFGGEEWPDGEGGGRTDYYGCVCALSNFLFFGGDVSRRVLFILI